MAKSCRGLFLFQQGIIERHIEEHKQFNNIPNDNKAIMDFVAKFGWLMREAYCRHICAYRNECDVDIDKLCFDSKLKYTLKGP